MRRELLAIGLVQLWALGACQAPSIVSPGDAGTDAGLDAGTDAGLDAGTDAGLDGGTDAGLDGGTDAGLDAGTDAGLDAGTNAGLDAGLDAGTDAGLDAGTDAGFDAGTNAGFDAGRPTGPGVPSSLTSTIVATPTTVIDDGHSASTLTVTIEDRFGQPVAGYQVVLSALTPGSSLNKLLGWTSASGVVSAQLTSTQPGVVRVTATVEQLVLSTTVRFISTACTVPDGGLFAVAAGSPIALDFYPEGFAVADMNGDGILDVVLVGLVPQPLDGPVAMPLVLLGDGSGGFAPADPANPGILAEFGLDQYWMTIGDFNNDGKLDIAGFRGTARSPSVVVLLGDGDGSFRTAIATPIESSGLVAGVTGDFNNDGVLDLALTNLANISNVDILLGDGTGAFSETMINAGIDVGEVTDGDFNADGRLDLAVMAYSSGEVSILLGDGAGGFSQAGVIPNPSSMAALSATTFVAPGVFAADGNADLVCLFTNNDGNSVSLLLGDGQGGFSATSQGDFDAGLYPSPALGDFNGDGHLDIAWTNSDGAFGMLFGDGDGGLTGLTSFTVGDETGNIAVGDFNGDGVLDLAFVSLGQFGGSGSLTILLNQCEPGDAQ